MQDDNLEAVEKSFGIDLSHIKPEDDRELLKQKMEEVMKDDSLRHLLPKKFLGPNGKMVDKYGKEIPKLEPVYKKPTQNFFDPADPLLAKYKVTMTTVPVIKTKVKGGYAYSPNPKFKGSYSVLKDQALLQRIGVASNLNVTVHIFPQFMGAMLHCHRCQAHKRIEDTTVFAASTNELMEPIAQFCHLHRHDGGEVEYQAKGQVSVTTYSEAGGRAFLED